MDESSKLKYSIFVRC